MLKKNIKENTLSAFLYSDHNYELASTLGNFTNTYGINLFYITDLKEFFIKDRDFDFMLVTKEIVMMLKLFSKKRVNNIYDS